VPILYNLAKMFETVLASSPSGPRGQTAAEMTVKKPSAKRQELGTMLAVKIKELNASPARDSANFLTKRR